MVRFEFGEFFLDTVPGADGKNPDVLSVGEGPGIASGIGIALFDSQGQQLPLNRPPGRWVPLWKNRQSPSA